MVTKNNTHSFNLLTELKTLRHYDTRVWMLCVSRLLVVASFTMCMMYFGIYLHAELHVPLRVVGTIMMIAAAISALSMMIGGTLSDRLGRWPLMWVATGLRALVFLGIAWVIQVKPDVWVLTGLYIGARIMGGFYLPAADAA